MSKKELQDLRELVVAEMDKQDLLPADVVRMLANMKYTACGKRNFYRFLAGSSLGHEKIAEIFCVLGLEVRRKK